MLQNFIQNQSPFIYHINSAIDYFEKKMLCEKCINKTENPSSPYPRALY
jgi:hypothetical protein